LPPKVYLMTQIQQATPLHVPDTDALRFLPEGPVPLENGRCSWVGIQHGLDATVGSLNLLEIESQRNESFELPGRPGFAFPTEQAGTFVVGCERSLGLFKLQDGSWQPFCNNVDHDVEGTIINDGWVYEDNLIFGTKDLQFATKKAGLYLYRGADNKLIRLRDDQICSNGKAITGDVESGLQLIDIDSPTRKIVRYSLNLVTAALGPAETILDLTDDPAVPDGAILTPDGKGLIVAMFRPEVAAHGETRWYDLDSGDLQCVWQTPGSPQNTCPALVPVGDQLKLLITTAVENLDAEGQSQCPNAGRIFLGETAWSASDAMDAPVFKAH